MGLILHKLVVVWRLHRLIQFYLILVSMNKDLSELRALTVMKALVDRGVPKNRLKAVGYGSTQPVSDNNTEAGRRLNRRTDIIIVGEKTENIGNPFLNFINNLLGK